MASDELAHSLDNAHWPCVHRLMGQEPFEVISKVQGALIALLGSLCHCCQNDGFEVDGHCGVPLPWSGRLLRPDLLPQFTEILAVLNNIQHSTDMVNNLNLQSAAATEQQSVTMNEIHRNVDKIQQSSQQSIAGVQRLLTINAQQETLMKDLVTQVSAFKLS